MSLYDDLYDDIKIVEEYVMCGSLSNLPGEEDAWKRVKKYIEESIKTPNKTFLDNEAFYANTKTTKKSYDTNGKGRKR